jgi:hypothetical protein
MATSTFSGAVRSEGGFQHYVKSTDTATNVVNSSGQVKNTLSVLTTEAATGITGGTGTVYQSGIREDGGIVTTEILVDLTGLDSAAAGDIIGQSTPAAHLGQITAADCGTVFSVRLECLEVPAGGDTDIDLYSATEATGALNDAITGLAETSIVNSGTLSAGTVAYGATIAANQYLYLVSVGATAATYTGGKLLITLKGYRA